MHIRDGLLLTGGGGKLRVRICDERAVLTVKGPRKGLARHEFEYPVPLSDAEDMISSLAMGRILSKWRFLVPFGGLVWEVDRYEAPLEGVTIAEVELPREDYPLVLPSWAGDEITGDPKWRKIALLAKAQELALASVTKASSD